MTNRCRSRLSTAAISSVDQPSFSSWCRRHANFARGDLEGRQISAGLGTADRIRGVCCDVQHIQCRRITSSPQSCHASFSATENEQLKAIHDRPGSLERRFRPFLHVGFCPIPIWIGGVPNAFHEVCLLSARVLSALHELGRSRPLRQKGPTTHPLSFQQEFASMPSSITRFCGVIHWTREFALFGCSRRRIFTV
jgi:hypothetical protein